MIIITGSYRQPSNTCLRIHYRRSIGSHSLVWWSRTNNCIITQPVFAHRNRHYRTILNECIFLEMNPTQNKIERDVHHAQSIVWMEFDTFPTYSRQHIATTITKWRKKLAKNMRFKSVHNRIIHQRASGKTLKIQSKPKKATTRHYFIVLFSFD